MIEPWYLVRTGTNTKRNDKNQFEADHELHDRDLESRGSVYQVQPQVTERTNEREGPNIGSFASKVTHQAKLTPHLPQPGQPSASQGPLFCSKEGQRAGECQSRIERPEEENKNYQKIIARHQLIRVQPRTIGSYPTQTHPIQPQNFQPVPPKLVRHTRTTAPTSSHTRANPHIITQSPTHTHACINTQARIQHTLARTCNRTKTCIHTHTHARTNAHARMHAHARTHLGVDRVRGGVTPLRTVVLGICHRVGGVCLCVFV